MNKKTPWLFIDLDGTLIDTLSDLRKVFFQLGQELGIRLSEDDFERCNGSSQKEIVLYLKKKSKSSVSKKILEDLYSRKLDYIYRRCKPRSGALEALQHIKKQGWRCALVTGAPKARAMDFIKANRMRDLFDFVISGEEVKHGKPNPDIYELAKKRAGRGYFFALEDSSNGIKSAEAAACLVLRFSQNNGKYFFSVSSFKELSNRLCLVDGAPFLIGFSARVKFFAHMGNVPNLSARIHKETDSLWVKEKKNNPYLYDGRVLVLGREEAPYCFSGILVPYRYIQYRLVKRDYLGIVQCGSTGIVKWRGKILLMRRSKNVSGYSGLYEFAPSGAIDKDSMSKAGDTIDFKKHILKELEEELSVSKSQVGSLVRKYLVFDVADHVLDVVYFIMLKDRARPRAGKEHTEIKLFTPSELKRAVLANPNRYLPLVRLFVSRHYE